MVDRLSMSGWVDLTREHVVREKILKYNTLLMTVLRVRVSRCIVCYVCMSLCSFLSFSVCHVNAYGIIRVSPCGPFLPSELGGLGLGLVAVVQMTIEFHSVRYHGISCPLLFLNHAPVSSRVVPHH